MLLLSSLSLFWSPDDNAKRGALFPGIRFIFPLGKQDQSTGNGYYKLQEIFRVLLRDDALGIARSQEVSLRIGLGDAAFFRGEKPSRPKRNAPSSIHNLPERLLLPAFV